MIRTLSPVQVAERCKTSRSAVMRALYSGALPSKRDNRQRWRIAPEDADAWAGQRSDTAEALSEHRPEPARTVLSDTPETMMRLAVAEARLADAQASLAEVKADRDAWKAQAERLTSEPRSVPVASGSFWSRLLGRP